MRKNINAEPINCTTNHKFSRKPRFSICIREESSI